MIIKYYRNLRNKHKYIEVHNDGHSHNTVRQFLYWYATGVKNWTGDGYLHRWRKRNLDELLEDYEEVHFDNKWNNPTWRKLKRSKRKERAIEKYKLRMKVKYGIDF